MVNTLTETFLRAFRDDGVVFPIPVLSGREVLTFRGAIDELESCFQHEMRRIDQSHLFFRWAYQLVTHKAILDVVEDLIGHDIFVQSSRIFYKHPHDDAYLSWHQDGKYFGLHSYTAPTAWIALSESTTDNGCLQVVRGSHKQGEYPFTTDKVEDNLETRGTKVMVDIDERRVVDVTLKAGEMSLHHNNIIHGSQPNRSDTKRIGFSVTYMTPKVKNTKLPVVRARGQKHCPHFELWNEPPVRALRETLAAHQEFHLQRGLPWVRFGRQTVHNQLAK
jgi:non-haem Fe2+, alpha-ketoglutarate-dependent halogenase